MENNIMRGDLFLFDFGQNGSSVQSGKRPVLVIQASDFNKKAPTVIVAAVTTVIKKRYLSSHVLLPADTGLCRPSMLLLEQLRTVSKDVLTDYIGCVDDEKTWRSINNAIRKIFGLWIYKPEKQTGDIRCLCPKCLQDYLSAKKYLVKRLDPFSGQKSECFKCDKLGYEYIICERKHNARPVSTL